MNIFLDSYSPSSLGSLIWNPWTSLRVKTPTIPVLPLHLLSFWNCENLCLSFKFHLFSFQWVDVEKSVNLMLNSKASFGILANWRHMIFHPYPGVTASSLLLTHFLLKALKIVPNMCMICLELLEFNSSPFICVCFFSFCSFFFFAFFLFSFSYSPPSSLPFLLSFLSSSSLSFSLSFCISSFSTF